MVRFWVGVSGFSYASWQGTFYPKGTKPDKMLEVYSAKLNSVEVNSTFYHMPTLSITGKWAKSTREDFRFSFKANRRITHIKKLKDAAEDFRYFVGAIKPVEEKLGCVLVQLPPYLRQNYGALEKFLSEKPEPVRLALEFRHSSWFGDELNKLLSKYNAALCVSHSEDTTPVFEKTADFTYFRLRRDNYSSDEIKAWAEKIGKFAEESSECFVYFKHDETGQAANVAAEFPTMLTRSG